MLYKGEGTADLDSCIYYATKIIEHGYYALESDYRNEALGILLSR